MRATHGADSKRSRRQRRAAVCGAAVLLATLLPASGCGRPSTENRPPNIILISLDTLRRDHVDCYRDRGASLTPNLQAVASEAVVFDNAWAQIPFTLPSHMSIFTGLYPDVHGVDRKRARLADSVPTLPGLLQGAGYHTVGLFTNLWMKGEFGFARGFDHYERIPYGLVYADRVNQRVWELLDDRGDDDRPLFLFLHYIDPHSDFYNVGENALPYYAPTELLADLDVSPDSREFCDDDGNCATDFLLAADREHRPLDPATIDRIAELYARGVVFLDARIGDLVEGLRSRGLWDDSLVLITSDHGEEFREHGSFIHIQPYVEDLALPLMVKMPRARGGGRRVPSTVETVDYLPTLLDAAGVPAPGHVQGRSLLPLLGAAAAETSERITLGRDKLDRRRYALRIGDFTLIHHLDTDHSELYDRGLDPDEQLDIADREPGRVAELEARLLELVERNREIAKTLAAPPSTDAEVLTDDDAEKLRAIGYLE